MYESHFGFTGAPFSLNPDPAFFFGSKGHSNALSYLKFGVYQGEGFVVVTGDIGAGKTTLVRTLLSELDQDRIVAAQIVSTQLEAGDLLRSVALAFGIAPKRLSKAELIATIEAFLTLLVTEERRALLIVDEAQNLHREAVEELRMLSNFQLGNQALLQSFLVGQPELRMLLTSKPMEQFRQRVIASCHLGPMDGGETRAYVEHRLHQVGWNNKPVFEPDAFDRVFHWSSGIPRRVNLLCNRLLLSAYLAEQKCIDAAAVDAIGVEVRSEVGESTIEPVTPSAAQPVHAAVAPASHKLDAATPSGTVHVVRPVPSLPERLVVREHAVAGPLMCVAGSPSDDVRFAPLLQALSAHALVPECLLLRIGDPACFALNDSLFALLGVDAPVLPLEIVEATAANHMAEVIRRFALVFEERRPSAVIVLGGSDSALACSLVAHKKNCSVIHIEAGVRGSEVSEGVNGLLIDRLSAAFYATQKGHYLNLIREGVGEMDLQHAGSLLVDAITAAAAATNSAQELRLRDIDGREPQRLVEPYGLVALNDDIARGDAESITELLSSLHQINCEAPLVWPVSRAAAGRLDMLNLWAAVRHSRIALVGPVTFVDGIALLRQASFVVTDEPDVQTQAALLQVRCLPVSQRVAKGREGVTPPTGDAGRQIANHLAGWMASVPLAGR